jgi:hypothetical protein
VLARVGSASSNAASLRWFGLRHIYVT